MRGALARVAVAVTTMVAFAFLFPLAMLVHQQARAEAISDAQRRAAAVGPILAVTSDPVEIASAMPAQDEGSIGVHLPDGSVVGVVRASQAQLRAARETSSGAVEVPGGTVVLQPIVLGREGVAVVEARVRDVGPGAGLARAWVILAGVAIALVTTSVLVADRLAARLVRAVDRLASSARALGAGDLTARVEPGGPYELGDVGGAFNAMAEQMRVLLDSERQFAAEVSHRLRTPLTALRLEAARLPASAAGDQVRQAVAAMEQQVDDVIRSARSGRPPERAWCDAAGELRTRMSFWSELGAGQGRSIRTELAEAPAEVPLPSSDLVAIIDALVGNVFRYTPPRTPLHVTLSTSRGRVSLSVEDAGPGLPAEVVDGSRSRRAGETRPGSTGLGLDIVRRHVDRVGGRLEVGRSALGGALVRLTLPDWRTWREGGPSLRRSRRSPRGLGRWRSERATATPASR